ncbi:MAG: hypothetical protein ABJQ29_12655 [Luteolibacter sp.]
MIRRILLIVSLFLLIGGVALLRSYRFERVPNISPVSLSDLKASVRGLPQGAEWVESASNLSLRVATLPESHLSIKFRLPVEEPLEALHVRLAMDANHLIRGMNEWDDGRVLIQWISPNENGNVEIDSMCSARDNESKRNISLVTRPSAGVGYPVLLIENLGKSGSFTITDLELSPVRPRVEWRILRWVLASAWILWIFVILSGASKLTFTRRFAAASAWVALSTVLAFPGPWKILPPMVIPYGLGGDFGGQHPGEVELPEKSEFEKKAPHDFASYEAHGKIPLSDHWIIQLKSHLKKFRPLLHIAFVFLIMVAFSWIVGVKRACWLAAGLVVAIETSQTGFGFGFDWKDVLDLACGVVGIFLARRLYARLAPCFSRLPRMLAPST